MNKVLGIKTSEAKSHAANIGAFAVGRLVGNKVDQYLEKIIGMGSNKVEGLSGFQVSPNAQKGLRIGALIGGGVIGIKQARKVKDFTNRRLVNYGIIGASSVAADIISDILLGDNIMTMKGLGEGEYTPIAPIPIPDFNGMGAVVDVDEADYSVHAIPN